MKYIQVGDEILLEETVETAKQLAVVRKHHCAAKKLVIIGASAVAAGSKLPLVVRYEDWQGNPLPDETRPIYVAVTGQGQAGEVILAPNGGQAELEFQSNAAGVFTVWAKAEFLCDKGSLEVTVSGG